MPMSGGGAVIARLSASLNAAVTVPSPPSMAVGLAMKTSGPLALNSARLGACQSSRGCGCPSPAANP